MLVLGALGLLCLPACSLGPQKCLFWLIFTLKYHFWAKCRPWTDFGGRWWCPGALWWWYLGWVMCSGMCACRWWVICLGFGPPRDSGGRDWARDADFIGRSRPFSPSGGPGVGGGWSINGWFCALGGGLQCGTHLQRLTSHREALGIADGGELSIFSLKIAGDPPSALSGSFCGGARVSPNGSF